ncbi:MAG: L,D-transpeptidase [Gammaproteobacteria bacterium]
MKTKHLLVGITAIALSTSAYAWGGNSDPSCSNNFFGCSSKHYNAKQEAKKYQNSSKPRFFTKNGVEYMVKDGRLYYKIPEQHVLPSNPFADRSRYFSESGPSNTFIFDPKHLSWAYYDQQGKLLRTGPASGGKDYCYDTGGSCKTPVGTFKVYSEQGAACKSNKYPLDNPGAPMPYCMFFHGGYAMHGSYDVPNYNASHGCIRLHPVAAKWLNQDVVKPGTRVVVRPYY